MKRASAKDGRKRAARRAPARSRAEGSDEPAAVSAATSAADAAEAAEIARIRRKYASGASLSRRDIAFFRAYEARKEERLRGTHYRTVQQIDLMEMLSVSRRAMLDWEASGMPVARTGRPKQYDLYAILPWLRKRWQEGDDTSGMASAKHGLLTERMLKTRLERMILEGELIPKADKEAQDVQKLSALRAGLLNMMHALLPVLQSLTQPEDQQRAFAEHVDYLLRGWSGERADADPGESK